MLIMKARFDEEKIDSHFISKGPFLKKKVMTGNKSWSYIFERQMNIIEKYSSLIVPNYYYIF